ncbi:MAG: right-handed parallel beta-helix repeat-containing protein [Promethearchaeota archaeon]
MNGEKKKTPNKLIFFVLILTLLEFLSQYVFIEHIYTVDRQEKELGALATIDDSNTSPIIIQCSYRHHFRNASKSVNIKSSPPISYAGYYQSIPLRSISYMDHTPIIIDGNVDFLSQAASEGWSGAGTFTDPILITGYKITNNSGLLLQIRNTNSYFKLSNNLFDGKGDIHEVGLRFENVSHGIIHDNFITNFRGRLGSEGARVGGAATGIYLANTFQLVFDNNIIIDITGGSGEDYSGQTGGAATGINITTSTMLTFNNNKISTIKGGSPGARIAGGCAGGPATGIDITDSNQLTFSNNTIKNIWGKNGDSGDSLSPGGSGGDGIGIFLKETDNVTFEDNRFDYISGGLTGDGRYYGYRGDSIGLFLINTKRITVKENNFFDISGVGISLKDSYQGTIQTNHIYNHNGRNGLRGQAGENIVGIQLKDAGSYTLSGNNITNMKGGDGGAYGRMDPGNGGNAIGISLLNSEYNEICNNSISYIIGGNGGDGDTLKQSGNGGNGIGIALKDTGWNTIYNNIILDCFGGKSGSGSPSGSDGQGIAISSPSSTDKISNNIGYNYNTTNFDPNTVILLLTVLAIMVGITNRKRQKET